MDIKTHLYTSGFLNGQTSDVCLRVSGSFHASYRLHKVVLIQAGFWHDCFLGGFLEETRAGRRPHVRKCPSRSTLSNSGEEVLDIVLDRNITRTAFELSLSRLYGGGPELTLHPSLIPTATRPLTSGFPYPPVGSLRSASLYPSNHQPATPEFLVSLLATSIYLSIPSLASEALTGILRTIGPRTVGFYLDFALGKTKLDGLNEPAVGLEGVADVCEEDEESDSETEGNSDAHCRSRSRHRPVAGSHDDDISAIRNESCHPVSPSSSVDSVVEPSTRTTSSKNSLLPSNPSRRRRRSSSRTKSRRSTSPPPFYYGPICDKIGEACACWLARWGADMFVEEEREVLDWLKDPAATLYPQDGSAEAEMKTMEGLSVSSDADPISTHVSAASATSASKFPKWIRSSKKAIPRLFTGSAMGLSQTYHEGLSPAWISALVSSDLFFIPSPSLYTSVPITSASPTSTRSPSARSSTTQAPSAKAEAGPEEERYAFAKRVVDLRRVMREKVRDLRRKQMMRVKPEEVGEKIRRQGGRKGKERALDVVDLTDEDHTYDDWAFESDTVAPGMSGEGWEHWQQNWERECREEESEWRTLFQTGIYYANMSPETLVTISNDIRPSTGLPYVNLRTLQEAAWEAGIVKSAILGSSKSSTGGDTAPSADKLGFAKTLSDTLSVLKPSSLSGPKPYFAIPTDESLRSGDTITSSLSSTNGNATSAEGSIHNNITMDELFSNSFGEHYRAGADEAQEGILRRSGTSGRASASKAPRSPAERINQDANEPGSSKTTNEKSFFGLWNDTATLHLASDTSPRFTSRSLSLSHERLISPYPPLRFSVEFFNLETLKDKVRLHSRTVWYAGSLWNVYTQLVKKKERTGTDSSAGNATIGPDNAPGTGLPHGFSLGVYLHRELPSQDLPAISAPDPFASSRWSSRSSALNAATSGARTRNPAATPSPTSPSSSSPHQDTRGPPFAPLTPFASAPQVASSSVTASGSTRAVGSRARGNSASAAGSLSSRPATSPGSSPTPSGSSSRPRTPGGSGGWRNLGQSHSTSGGSGFLSSSLPSAKDFAFPNFGRARNQASGSRDNSGRDISYNLPNAAASSSYVGDGAANSSNAGASTSGPSSAIFPSPTPRSPSTLAPSPSLTTPTASHSPPSSSLSASSTATSPPYQATPSGHPNYPYLDPRPITTVYFSVNCASPTGNAQTRFRSGPDVFQQGQSWGWKSGGLIGGPASGTSVTNGDIEAVLLQMDNEWPAPGQEVSLRATVVLGVV